MGLTICLNRIYAENNPNITVQVMGSKEAFCAYGIAGINGAIVVNNRIANKRMKH